MKLRRFTEEEKKRLIADYPLARAEGRARDLAAEMGRTPQFLSRQARALGLTSYEGKRPYNFAKLSSKAREWHASHDHPRGFAGYKHSDSARQKMSASSKRMYARLTPEEVSDIKLRALKTKVAKYGTAVTPRYGTTWKAEWRTIGGKKSYYRSSWEANYARYLEWLKCRGDIKDWKHEPKTFWFEAIRRGTRSYLPDFEVTENNGSVAYHEVKGWMDDRSKTKINRMRIYYPSVKLIVIDNRSYASILKQLASIVPGWESSGVRDKRQWDFLSELKP